MALIALYYTIGAILAGTVLFALVVAISARKIDFGDRLFKIRDRVEPIVGSSSKRRAKRPSGRGKVKSSLPPSKPVHDSSPEEEDSITMDRISSDAFKSSSPGEGYAPQADDIKWLYIPVSHSDVFGK